MNAIRTWYKGYTPLQKYKGENWLIDSFILFDVRQVCDIFPSECCTESDLVLPFYASSILTFPQGHPVDAYVFFLVFQSLLLNMKFINERIRDAIGLFFLLLFFRFSSIYAEVIVFNGRQF
jgi:hypothetical protein